MEDNMDYIKPFKEARKVELQLNEEGKSGNRSSQRTDVLNDYTIELIKKHIPENNLNQWRFETEENIDCSRGDTFSIDVLCYHNDQLKCLLLLKAIGSSYNKNRHNYANTVEGECARIFDYEEREDGLSVIFIDWIPNKVPAGTKMETPNIPDLTKSEKRWNSFLADRDSSVSFCKVRFDLGTYKNISGADKLKESLVRSFS